MQPTLGLLPVSIIDFMYYKWIKYLPIAADLSAVWHWVLNTEHVSRGLWAEKSHRVLFFLPNHSACAKFAFQDMMNWLILPSIIGSFLCLNCKAGFKAGYSSLNITRCRPVPILPNLTWPQRSRAFIGRYISHNANNIYISLELILVAECLNEIISKQHSRSPPPKILTEPVLRLSSKNTCPNTKR